MFYKVLILLAVPAVIIADEDPKPEDCYKKPELTTAYNAFETDLDAVVKNGVEGKTQDYDKVNTSLKAFQDTVKEACKGDLSESKQFLELIKKATDPKKLKELKENNGVECLKSKKDEISKCIDKKHPENKVTTLTALSTLSMSGSEWTCQETKKVKDCTMEIIKKDATNCKDNVEKYLSYLFAQVEELCKKPDNKPEQPKNEEQKKENGAHISTSSIIMTCFLTLGVLVSK